MPVLFFETYPLIIYEVFCMIGMEAYSLQNAPFGCLVAGSEVFLEAIKEMLLELGILKIYMLLLLHGLH